MNTAILSTGSIILISRSLATVAALCGALWLSATPAAAHGRLGATEGRCRLNIGPDVMNFTGYLPEASKNEFCEDIPSTGPMIMVLDSIQDELRDMQVSIRIVKDVGGEEAENENLDAVTVAYSPPKKYPGGTINFEHDFKEGGYYVGIVTVLGDHGESWTSRFPFSVDRTFMRDLPSYLMMTLGVLAVSTIYLVHRRRQTAAPQVILTTGGGPGRGDPGAGVRETILEENVTPSPEGQKTDEAHQATPAE
jgi:hypothetical protein